MESLRRAVVTDTEESLDPIDWSDVRALARRIIDASIGYLRDVRERPLWQEMPVEVKATFDAPLPRVPSPFDLVYR
jgi:hypothetical protein